eukprot:TRINITY_DN3892_c0_g1_i3.p1 TRINITY_DN3892_c0_g1~~TRINITY_DN3892_c0_g1_i3.p1  ORF type:complete len:310 (-),score=41.32 TRINITY_DN3892_c0_g1_i3:84-1013(-)
MDTMTTIPSPTSAPNPFAGPSTFARAPAPERKKTPSSSSQTSSTSISPASYGIYPSFMSSSLNAPHEARTSPPQYMSSSSSSSTSLSSSFPDQNHNSVEMRSSFMSQDRPSASSASLHIAPDETVDMKTIQISPADYEANIRGTGHHHHPYLLDTQYGPSSPVETNLLTSFERDLRNLGDLSSRVEATLQRVTQKLSQLQYATGAHGQPVISAGCGDGGNPSPFCTSCGTRFQQESGARFCANCGTSRSIGGMGVRQGPSFSTNTMIPFHQRAPVAPSPVYTCFMCNMRFQDQDNVNTHLASVHPELFR